MTHLARPLAASLALTFAAPVVAQYTSYQDRTFIGGDDGTITPNGRLAIVRTNGATTRTQIYDLAEGTLLASLTPQASGPSASGPCNDAVEATNTRAVSLGSRTLVIDLTAQPPVAIAEYDFGARPRDLALSTDGRFAIIRGGELSLGGGTHVIDLQSGALLLSRPSGVPEIFVIGNDLAAATRDHGLALSHDANADETGILVVEFDPPSGGGPRVVLETLPPMQLDGRPMDVHVSPDGRLAAVRAENEIALLRLDGTNTQIIERLSTFPGPTLPYLDTTFDSVVMTNDVYASITIGDGLSADGYLSVGDEAGVRWFALLDGTPRDLAVTPDGDTLLVHTGQKLYQFDIGFLPAGGGPLGTLDFRPLVASASGLLAGLDSVECTNDVAVAMAPMTGGTRVRLYDIKLSPSPTPLFSTVLPGIPLDVDLSRDGAWAVAVTQDRYRVIDVRSQTVRLDVAVPNLGSNGFPWSDAVAVHPDHAAAFGFEAPNSATGWADTIDLVSREALSCRSLPNSTGQTGALFALGSTRVASNDLELRSRFVPPIVPGLFLLGSGQGNVLLGGGRLCLGGSVLRFPLQVTGPDGSASEPVDITALPPVAGGVVVGSTWYAQFAFRDAPTSGGFNYSNASSLLFE